MGPGGTGSQGYPGGDGVSWGWPCGHAGGGGGGTAAAGTGGSSGGSPGGDGAAINPMFRDPVGASAALSAGTWFGDTSWRICGGGGGHADCGGNGAGGAGGGGNAVHNGTTVAGRCGGAGTASCYNNGGGGSTQAGEGLMYVAVPYAYS